MTFLENPFHLLGASTRDSRQRLLELAEEHALAADAAGASGARAILTNPKNRLSAELRWFPGLSPARARQLAGDVQRAIPDRSTLAALHPLAAANLLTGAIVSVSDVADAALLQAILAIGDAVEAIEPESLRALINEERAIAGFPLADGGSEFQAALDGWADGLADSIVRVLRQRSSESQLAVLTAAISEGTAEGTDHGPALLHAICGRMEADLAGHLDTRLGAVDESIQELTIAAEQGAAESALLSMAQELERRLQEWDRIAQPLQLSAQSRGAEHEHSVQVAARLRGLALALHNDHSHTAVSERITAIMESVFAELPMWAERIEADRGTLRELLERREESAREWAESIYFEDTIGLLGQHRLRISVAGVEYDGKVIPLEAVTRVRWGGTRQSVNGIPVGTEYTVLVGSPNEAFNFTCRSGKVYQGFLACLWRAVVGRLMSEMAARLAKGEQIGVANALVEDDGVWLTRERWFSANQVRKFSWADVGYFSQDGALVLRGSSGETFEARLPYQTEDNVHVFEGLLGVLGKRGASRFGELLGS